MLLQGPAELLVIPVTVLGTIYAVGLLLYWLHRLASDFKNKKAKDS
jgi:hypothetical protein